MSKIFLGIVCGVVFGIVSVAAMIPLRLEDKKRAMIGAFTHRFAVGFVVCNSALPLSGWLNGLFLGLLLGVPDAIITKAWAPILGLGAVGGMIIGIIAG